MKKLIYIICFGAAVAGFGDIQAGNMVDGNMQAADLAMEAAIARTTEQVTQIEQNQRLEKIKLCAFDFNGVMAALEAKKAEIEAISHAAFDTRGGMTKQQFRDAYPEFAEFEENPLFRADFFGHDKVRAIRFALSVVQNAHVQPRDAAHPVTEDEMSHIISTAAGLFQNIYMMKSYFSGLPE